MNPESNAVDSEKHMREGLAFFGAITASVSHELNNVLGTVDQITGLVEDLSYSLSQGEEVTSDRLNEITGRINRQTERGAVLIKRLNKFAHSADKPITDFSLNDALINIVALMDRLAKMQKTELALDLPESDIKVKGDLFALIQTVFHLIKRMISVAEPGAVQKIAVLVNENEIVITFDASTDGTLSGLSGEDYIHSLAGSLLGTVVETIEDKHLRIEFRFPTGGGK
jgi:C4-dicarboxylate-specific signal transduction histidine kinase